MNIQRKEKILRSLYRVDSKILPTSIQAGITDYCINKCYMCDHHKRKNKTFINTEDWINFLNIAHEVETICYSGGDSILHEGINQIMRKHIKLKKAFSFITSGYIPGKVDLSLLKQAEWVRISLDAMTQEVYEESRGGKTALYAIINDFYIMKNAGVNIEFSTTIHEKNYHEVEEIINFAFDHNININIKPRYGKAFVDFGLIEIIQKSKRKFFNKGLKFSTALSLSFSDFKFCKAVYYQCFIDAKGDMYPCCLTASDTGHTPMMSPLGNIKNIDEYLINRKIFSETQKDNLPDTCRTCSQRFIDINSIANSPKNIDFF